MLNKKVKGEGLKTLFIYVRVGQKCQYPLGCIDSWMTKPMEKYRLHYADREFTAGHDLPRVIDSGHGFVQLPALLPNGIEHHA